MTPYSITIVALTILGLIGCLGFVIGYWWVTGGKWIKNEAGQFLMTYAGSVAGLLTILLLNQWLVRSQLWLDSFRRPITLLVSIAFVTSLWWPWRLLWLAQRNRREARSGGTGLEADVHVQSDPRAE